MRSYYNLKDIRICEQYSTRLKKHIANGNRCD